MGSLANRRMDVPLRGEAEVLQRLVPATELDQRGSEVVAEQRRIVAAASASRYARSASANRPSR